MIVNLTVPDSISGSLEESRILWTDTTVELLVAANAADVVCCLLVNMQPGVQVW